MSQATPVRGLLLDAGGVLYGPVGGRWNPRLDFESVVARFNPALGLARDPVRVAAAHAPPAPECLFVDDDPQLVEAAVALGYQGVALARKRPHAPADVPWIDSLEGVLDYLPG